MNEKFRENNNIVLYYNYKMSHPVIPQYLRQSFKARVVGSDVRPRSAETLFNIKISDIVGYVDATYTDAAGDLKVDEYPRMDTTAIDLGLTSGSSVLLQIGQIDGAGRKLAYKVLSLSKDPEPGAGALTFTVSGDGGAPGVHPVSVAVTVVPPIAAGPLQFHDWWGWSGAQNNEMIEFATYEENWDKSSAVITFNNPDTGGPIFVPSSKSVVPYLITGKRVGSKKTATMVGFLDRVCVDGRRTRMRLSKKGLKSKGNFAKKAVAGFTSGEYRIQSIAPAPTRLTPASSNPPQGDGWKMFGAWLAPTIPTKEGTLTKTDVLGTYTLKFELGEKERVYKYDPETKTVSSIRVNDYLGEFAPRLSGIAASTLVKIELGKLERGGPTREAQIFGLVVDLAWSDEPSIGGGGWKATVRTSLADAKRLANVTDVKEITIVGGGTTW